MRFSKVDDTNGDEQPVLWSFSETANVQLKLSQTPEQHLPVRRHTSQRIRVEDGFIRSRGLGSDFTAPASLVFDPVGLYFDANGPSALEELLNNYQCSEDDLARAQMLRAKLLSANMTKYNVGTHAEKMGAVPTLPSDKKIILVVGQVEGDQSIIRGTQSIKSNTELLTQVRASNPDDFIVYKPHPDVVSGNRQGAVTAELTDKLADRVEVTRGFTSCLDDSDELHTMTSLSGFEALLRHKKVVTYGMPFYSGWGLTTDLYQCDRRRTARTIDELVFVSLIMYPHYIDLKSGEFVTAEQIVQKLATMCSGKSLSNDGSVITKVVNIASALSYSA